MNSYIKYTITSIFTLFVLSAVNGQTYLDVLSANAFSTGDNTLGVSFTVTEASNETIGAIEVWIKIATSEATGADVSVDNNNNPLGLVQTNGGFTVTGDPGFTFWSFSATNDVDLSSRSVGQTISVGSFVVTGPNVTEAIVAGDVDTPVCFSGLCFFFGTGATSGETQFVSQPVDIPIGIVLPVELISFTANPYQDNSAKLEWSTAVEINNDYFSIEHSSDGRTFDEIGLVDGAGSTLAVQQYNFVHDAPSAGVNYYRLKQIDFDGQFEYSNVEAVTFGDQVAVNFLNLYPNPTDAILNVSSAKLVDQPVEIKIFNHTGTLVFVQNYDAYPAINEIQVDQLPAGTYILQATTSGDNLVRPFVVSK